MNIQYQRNLKSSYMVVIEPGQPLNMDGQLAEKMMQRQQIPGLLRWVSMEHEGDLTFWYQITGLKSLSDWLRHHTLDYALLGHLLSGLLALQEELPRFYLKAEHLLLQPEQIFLDASGEKAVFCYESLWIKDPQESLRDLMETLLPKIDHGDKDAVRLGYGLYEKCQEENADIWHYVFEEGTYTEKTLRFEQETCEQAAPDPVAETNPKPREECAGEQEKRLRTPMDSIREKRNRISDTLAEKMPSVSALSWMQSVKKNKKERPAPVYLFEPEQEAAVSANPTVCLSAKENAEGRLIYQGAGGEQSFVIEGDTFLLGGRNDQADGQLQASGVSRNHARITREDDHYYIEDLNSRNGTYVNGKLLPYKQKCPVKPGDHLRFAREEYVFY